MKGDGGNAPGLGALALVLHGHMPYVTGFGTWPFGEEWLWEAIATVYVPLFETIDGRPVTLGLTPVLCDQLELLESDDAPERERLVRFLRDLRVRLVGEDAAALERSGSPELASAIASQGRPYARALELLAGGYAPLARARRLREVELITSAATHPVLPLVASERVGKLQVATGVASQRRRFGAFGGGLWLPECAWAPQLERVLAPIGVRYVCVDRTRELGIGALEHLEPVALRSGLVAVPIDWATVALVWDERTGYPTAPEYRDYYRGTEHHFNAWSNDGRPYDPARAAARAARDAQHFVEEVASRLRAYRRARGRNGLVCCALDAELLGHWWAEGPLWLRHVLDSAAEAGIALVTLRTAAALARPDPGCRLPVASWGTGKDLSTWDCAATDEIVHAARQAELELLRVARIVAPRDPRAEPALARAARELLALQASDWAFMHRKRTAGPYPLERARAHRREFDIALAALEHSRPVEAATVGNLAPDLALEYLFVP